MRYCVRRVFEKAVRAGASSRPPSRLSGSRGCGPCSMATTRTITRHTATKRRARRRWQRPRGHARENERHRPRFYRLVRADARSRGPRCPRTRPLPARLLIEYALQTMLLGVMRHPSSRNSLGSPGWHSARWDFGSIRVAFVSGQSGGCVPDRHGLRGESQPYEMPATTHP